LQAGRERKYATFNFFNSNTGLYNAGVTMLETVDEVLQEIEQNNTKENIELCISERLYNEVFTHLSETDTHHIMSSLLKYDFYLDNLETKDNYRIYKYKKRPVPVF